MSKEALRQSKGRDPNEPGSVDYQERHRITEQTLPNGMTVVSVGEPILR